MKTQISGDLKPPRSHVSDFSFQGRRYRVALSAPPTARHVKAVQTAVAAFTLKQARNKPQLLYFFVCGEQIKIGIARDITKRKRSLQTGSPNELVLLASISGDRYLERAVHEKFASLRIHGEWFRAASDLFEFIERVRRATSLVVDPETGDVRTLVSASHVSALAPRNRLFGGDSR